MFSIQFRFCLLLWCAIGSVSFDAEGFEILAPTTRRNVLRVLRAMQLPKPGMSLSVQAILPNIFFVRSFCFCFYILITSLTFLIDVMHSSSIRR